jgi:dTDP-glucose 4,6-dehydratase
MAARRASAKLVVLDSLTYAGNIANIAELMDSGAVVFVHGDIRDAELLTTFVCRI